MFRLRITGDLGFEVWQDIPEYEGLYQVSSYGRVKSLKRYYKTGRGGLQLLPERMCKLRIKRTGYVEVALCKNGVHRCFLVHRIIGKLFVPNPNHYPVINHRDENKLSNIVSNLEWCDNSYNINYGTRNERLSDKLSKQVLQYDLNGNLIAIHKSATDIQRKTRFNQSNICECCNGKRKTAHGYIWKYAD